MEDWMMHIQETAWDPRLLGLQKQDVKEEFRELREVSSRAGRVAETRKEATRGMSAGLHQDETRPVTGPKGGSQGLRPLPTHHGIHLALGISFKQLTFPAFQGSSGLEKDGSGPKENGDFSEFVSVAKSQC